MYPCVICFPAPINFYIPMSCTYVLLAHVFTVMCPLPGAVDGH